MVQVKIEYYVYLLIEPDGDPFYVGKGYGDRMFKHEQQAKTRVPHGNYELKEQIQKILDSGEKIIYEIVFKTYNETEAFEKEKELIDEIGLQNLCNKIGGGAGGSTDISPETRRKMSVASKDRKISLKTRRKLSESHKGLNIWSKGTTHTAQTIRKMSGKIPWNKGKTGVYSKEHLQQMSESRKGEKSPNFGKKASKETRRKMSESRKGDKNPNFGKKASKETRRKMSESLKKYYLSKEASQKI